MTCAECSGKPQHSSDASLLNASIALSSQAKHLSRVWSSVVSDQLATESGNAFEVVVCRRHWECQKYTPLSSNTPFCVQANSYGRVDAKKVGCSSSPHNSIVLPLLDVSTRATTPHKGAAPAANLCGLAI